MFRHVVPDQVWIRLCRRGLQRGEHPGSRSQSSLVKRKLPRRITRSKNVSPAVDDCGSVGEGHGSFSDPSWGVVLLSDLLSPGTHVAGIIAALPNPFGFTGQI